MGPGVYCMAIMSQGIYNLLSTREVHGLTNLAVGSRFTVEGNLQGAHRSPLRGFSVEFADYRQYVPGDDLRHLDWKAMARNERLYIRQYEEECNLRMYLLVDASASMGYGQGELTKFRHAARLAAALAFVTIHQQDSVGLTVFDRITRVQLPARSGLAHLRSLADTLSEQAPSEETNMAESLHRLAGSVHRRGLVVVISDFLDDMERIQAALAHFRHRKHDVIVYHVLDPAELDLPFRRLSHFRDPETGEKVLASPREVRAAYRKAIARFLQQCRSLCASLDVDYVQATTNEEVTDLVRRHLSRRQRRGR